jgi:enamine deaminase RidA (YjgF/YER057c/UK114 family)
MMGSAFLTPGMTTMQRELALFGLPILVLGAALMTNGGASAQTPSVRYINPPAIAKPPGYTHVVEVNGPVRTIYIAGQLGYDGTGKQGADFREQATLVYENLKAAVESVGGKMENIVKLNAFLTDIRTQLPIYREVRDKFVNVAAPPASTTLEVSKLAREGALLEVEAVAVLPAR